MIFIPLFTLILRSEMCASCPKTKDKVLYRSLYRAFVAVRTRVKFINRDLGMLNNYWVRIFHRAIDDYYKSPRRCEIQKLNLINFSSRMCSYFLEFLKLDTGLP